MRIPSIGVSGWAGMGLALGSVALGALHAPKWVWIIVGIAAILCLLRAAFLHLRNNGAAVKPAIRAVREEIGYIERRLDEESEEGIPKPILPATSWNQHRGLLRERLDPATYESTYDAFDAVDRYNRTGAGLAELRRRLKAADAALDSAQ